MVEGLNLRAVLVGEGGRRGAKGSGEGVRRRGQAKGWRRGQNVFVRVLAFAKTFFWARIGLP
jgi:hypothetical protein